MSVQAIGLLVGVMLVCVLFAVAMAFVRLWLQHRARLAMLAVLERRGGSQTISDLNAALAGFSADPGGGQRSDPVWIGLFMAIFGVLGVAAGFQSRVGQLAVGMYLGGQICLLVAFLFLLYGLTVRFLEWARHFTKR